MEHFSKHSGKCDICGVEDKLRIDHDHLTGKIRGLLCNECNLGLGKFQDDVSRLREAAVYVERHRLLS